MIKKLLSKIPFGFVFYLRKFISSEKKYDYQSRYIKFDIRENEKVLDIGSGGEPFPHATHLLDKFPGKTQHRYNRLKTNQLPFTQGDVQALPFADLEFDFIYCAHVLEHVEDPAKALEEIMRAGKRGYIEVPTRMSDIVFNFARLKHFHKWHISMLGNTLIFKEYADWETRDTGSQELFFMAHSHTPNLMRSFYRKNKDLFTNMFLWEKRFNYYIFGKEGDLIASNVQKL